MYVVLVKRLFFIKNVQFKGTVLTAFRLKYQFLQSQGRAMVEERFYCGWHGETCSSTAEALCRQLRVRAHEDRLRVAGPRTDLWGVARRIVGNAHVGGAGAFLR